MAGGRTGLGAGEGNVEGDVVAGPEGVGLVVAHFDAAAAVTGAEAVGGDVFNLRTLQPGQVGRGGGAFHHEGRLKHADVEVPVGDADIGDRHLVEQRIALARRLDRGDGAGRGGRRAGRAGDGGGRGAGGVLAAIAAARVQADFILEVAEGLALDAEIGPAHHRAAGEVGGTGKAGRMGRVLRKAGEVGLHAGADGQGETTIAGSEGGAAIVEIPDRGIIALLQGGEAGAVGHGAIVLRGERVFQRLHAGGQFGIGHAAVAGCVTDILGKNQWRLDRIGLVRGARASGDGDDSGPGHQRQFPQFHTRSPLL